MQKLFPNINFKVLILSQKNPSLSSPIITKKRNLIKYSTSIQLLLPQINHLQNLRYSHINSELSTPIFIFHIIFLITKLL